MNVITKRERIRTVAARWDAQFGDLPDKRGTGARLSALDGETATEADVAAIVDLGWIEVRCDACRKEVDVAIDIMEPDGEDDDETSRVVRICFECVQKTGMALDRRRTTSSGAGASAKGEVMTTTSQVWGTGVCTNGEEIQLAGSMSGLGGIRLRRIRIGHDVEAADLPHPVSFGINMASHLIASGEFTMSHALFMELLQARMTAIALEQAVAASGHYIPGFANLAKQSDRPKEPCHNCDECGTGDPPEATSPLATATLIEYENRIESTNPVGGLATLNRIFAEGWQFQCQIGADLILLKRRKG